LATDILRVAPGALPEDAGDQEYASVFAAIARAVDGCDDKSAKVALLLSTCRNEFLTTNAIYVDLQMTLGSGTRASPIETAVTHLKAGQPKLARAAIAQARTVLHQVPLKFEVWAERKELLEAFRNSVNTLPPQDREFAKRVLTTSVHPRDRGGAPWDGAYLALSTKEEDCGALLEDLRRASQRLSDSLGLLSILADAEGSDGNWEPHLVETLDIAGGALDDGEFEAPQLVTHHILNHGETWRVTAMEDGIEVALAVYPGDGWSVPAPESPAVREFRGSTTRESFAAATLIAEDAIASVQQRLRGAFRPNTAAKPLPEPFIIDLSSPHVAPAMSPGFQVARPQFAPAGTPPDMVKVGVLGATIAEDLYGHGDHYQYAKSTDASYDIVGVINAALDASVANGVSVLVLPEYFIPRRAVEEVMERADAIGVALIGGVEARSEPDGRTVNEVVVQFPGHVSEMVRKQRPSIFEPGPEHFASDGRLLVCRDTILGDVAVVVCSDFLEADLMAALTHETGRHVHTIVVCTRNPRTERFKTLAIADATRLYANVIVSNSEIRQRNPEEESSPVARSESDGGTRGCLLARPEGSGIQDPLEVFEFSGPPNSSLECSLLIWDVNMKAIRSRTHRSVDRSWWKASYFATERF
jgi:hypothetical protein